MMVLFGKASLTSQKCWAPTPHKLITPNKVGQHDKEHNAVLNSRLRRRTYRQSLTTAINHFYHGPARSFSLHIFRSTPPTHLYCPSLFRLVDLLGRLFLFWPNGQETPFCLSVVSLWPKAMPKFQPNRASKYFQFSATNAIGLDDICCFRFGLQLRKWS